MTTSISNNLFIKNQFLKIQKNIDAYTSMEQISKQFWSTILYYYYMKTKIIFNGMIFIRVG